MEMLRAPSVFSIYMSIYSGRKVNGKSRAGRMPRKTVSDLTDEEKILIFALGALGNTPLRTKVMIQKLLFLFSNVFTDFKGLFRYEPHMLGPYSEAVENTLQSLIQLGMITDKSAKYQLTPEGLSLYKALAPMEEIVRVVSDFKEFLNDLSDDEILAFIYSTYPDFISESARWNRLKPRRVELAISLLRKKKVSFSKAAEIAGMTAGDVDRTLKEKRVRWRG
jgi:uncharacterized protein YwgA